ncbi:OB-fold nucleic acid binding domain protein [Talaromyces stipitatus ATCC 10500]|uniref:OB-fold nucleic acid binding domain protein n=1 Tax=Talaromyces stipitatus (strain ATCC 10500 / CBS 375.48 / QM 6759 / NRRL 1006) TaxID=441959 RepID=B8M3M4_TALSN|nr:OB-fold nucleic acid binding domain protein [Talaromyces stipitatus ATCC 10500]EED22396.1 OB-fold nucleic acid binding domain protein [Talaromyces stipitatus ATCC 10500]
MAENAYSSSTTTNTAPRETKKRAHYRDDTDKNIRSRKYEQDNEIEKEAEELLFYPAFCFPASPTHFTWVKMSIADIHHLQSRKGFEGQNIYFYKNHPIQFVCVAGYIVSRQEYERRTLLTIDDSSGTILEVVCLKAPVKNSAPTETPTTTETTNVTSTTRTPIDISTLQIGTAVKLKGTLSQKFFNQSDNPIMQLILERFWLLANTTAEVKFWSERSRYLIDVLSQPWHLTRDQIESLRQQALSQERKVIRDRRHKQERQKRHDEKEEKYRRRILKKWEVEERLRADEDERVRVDNRRLERWLALKREGK